MPSTTSQSVIENTQLDDPILIALGYLSVRDILALSQTCRRMWALCLTKQIWMHVWRRDILQANIPHPTQYINLDTLEGFEMKTLVIHTLQLHRSMARPASTAQTLRQVLFPQSQPITWIKLVGGAWLLVAMSDSSSSVLSLFSVQSLLGPRSHDLLAQAFLDGHVVNGFVECSEEHGPVIALELDSPSCTLEVLSIRSCQDSLAFVRLAKYQGVSHLRALHGSTIGFSLHDDLSVPSLLNWTTGTVLHLRDRPDINGGTIAMAFKGDYLALLAPRRLSVLQRVKNARSSVKYTTIASFPVLAQIGSAAVDFSQGGGCSVLQACIVDDRGIYFHSVAIDPCQPATQASLETRFTKTCKDPEGDEESRPDLSLIARPLLDGPSGTVSWLETLFDFSPMLSPVRLMVATPGIAETPGRHASLHTTTCFSPSERDVPALYALSVRDHLPALGLLAIGNIIGELGIYSLNENTVNDILGILNFIVVPEWSGQELVSKLALLPPPPRPLSWEREGFASEAEKSARKLEWDRYWPRDLMVPNNWIRASPYDGGTAYDFCGSIGCAAWVLETGCHFFGRPIPLIQEDSHSCTTLLTVGGLFLLYEPKNESDEPLFLVLNPELDLEGIVALLADNAIDSAIVNATADMIAADEIRRLLPITDWEARHGIFRWKSFRRRGGRFDDRWLENRKSGTIFPDDKWCTDCYDNGIWSCGCTRAISEYDSRL